MKEIDALIWGAGWLGILFGLFSLQIYTSKNSTHKILWWIVIVGYVYFTLIYPAAHGGPFRFR